MTHVCLILIARLIIACSRDVRDVAVLSSFSMVFWFCQIVLYTGENFRAGRKNGQIAENERELNRHET